MAVAEELKAWFAELTDAKQGIVTHASRHKGGAEVVTDQQQFQRWATGALAAIDSAFGSNAVHTRAFRRLYEGYSGYASDLGALRGVFEAAHADLLKGRAATIEAVVSGEVLGDFSRMAKVAFTEGAKDVAAVLISAALEDAMKRYARHEGLDVDDKNLATVINALKAKGLIAGARKTLADALPDFRDRAMHADWGKIASEEVAAVIGFVDEFLLAKFSS